MWGIALRVAARLIGAIGSTLIIQQAWENLEAWLTERFTDDRAIQQERIATALTDTIVAAQIMATNSGIRLASALFREELISTSVYIRCCLMHAIVVERRASFLTIDVQSKLRSNYGDPNVPEAGIEDSTISRMLGLIAREAEKRGLIDLL